MSGNTMIDFDEVALMPVVSQAIQIARFETWATREGFNTARHPLCQTYLDGRTASAFEGWMAARKEAGALDSKPPRRDSLISDQAIEAAFAGTDFGGMDHRSLLEQGVLKIQSGYACGHTLTRILIGLDLIKRHSTAARHTLTKKGKDFLFNAFYDASKSG